MRAGLRRPQFKEDANMFNPDTSRLGRIASAIGLAAVIAISILTSPRIGGHAPPGGGANAAEFSQATVTRLPEVVVVATRLDSEGPGAAH